MADFSYVYACQRIYDYLNDQKKIQFSYTLFEIIQLFGSNV